MSGDIPYEIIFFALVAAFLILRLRSVLGRRDGHESRGTDPFKPAPPKPPANDKVVQLPDRSERPMDIADKPEDAVAAAVDSDGAEGGIAQIRLADPQFDANTFVSGARIAFEMILTAYAAGDTDTLRPLLSPEVFGNFEQSMRDREQAGEHLEISLIAITTAEIVEAYMAGRTAHLTMKFVSEQTSVTRNDNGEVLEGDPDNINTVTDFWTFARDSRSRNPNWVLVATGSSE